MMEARPKCYDQDQKYDRDRVPDSKTNSFIHAYVLKVWLSK